VSVPDAAAAEQRATPAELFWDLVFVFCVTQVTTLLYDDLSWSGFGRVMLVLALVWWAWSAFVWVTNAHDPNDTPIRACSATAPGPPATSAASSWLMRDDAR
jgi:low temperature requirement protein LtrA